MNLRDQMRRADSRTRRVATTVEERFAENERIRQELVKVFGDRLAQVERNTARIDKLEADMAAVLAALPKIKGI